MASRNCIGFGSVIAISALSILASSARALPVDQYIKLRRTEHCDRSLAFEEVSANPTLFEGKVIELRGNVNGSIRKTNAIAFLLALPDGKSIFMDAPQGDAPMVANGHGQGVRVLVRVAPMKSGSNMLQLAPLAIAYEGEVSLRDKEAEAAEAAAAARKQAQAHASNPEQTKFASRGTTYRQSAGFQNPAAQMSISSQAMRVLSQEAQSIYPYYRNFILKCNKKLSQKQLDDITCSVLYFSQQHKVDPRLVCAMIIAESDFDPKCTSNKGAMGLGQVMPDEASQYKLSNPYDPVQNVGAAVGLLKTKLMMYGDPTNPNSLTLRQIQLALAAYNAGPGAVKKYGGIPPYRETQGYVKRILSTYKELCGG